MSLSVTNGHDISPDMNDEPVLEHLPRVRELPFIDRIDLRPPPLGSKADFAVELSTKSRQFRLCAKVFRSHLSRSVIDHFVASLDEPRKWIVFAPYIGRPIAELLEQEGVNFADKVGNISVALGDRYFARDTGKRPPKKFPQQAGMRAPGYQVLFALLADPALARRPVREVADAAGVGKTVVAEVLRRLDAEGMSEGSARSRVLVGKEPLLERWLVGYADVLRPRLVVGRFHPPERSPIELEDRLEKTLGELSGWAWGGTAAAYRLTGHFRGDDTVLHLADVPFDLAKRLRALPDPRGRLIVMRAPGPISFHGAMERTVHPLLVYAELLVDGREREREAALEIRERFLSEK